MSIMCDVESSSGLLDIPVPHIHVLCDLNTQRGCHILKLKTQIQFLRDTF
jgi:hypothetical protein